VASGMAKVGGTGRDLELVGQVILSPVKGYFPAIPNKRKLVTN